jgi:DNA-binding MarR family transcriptional regulator
MRKASRRLTQFYDDALAPSGLRSTQFSILAELDRRSEPPTLNELAETLILDRSTLGHNLRPLERDGLLALQEGEEDARYRNILLKPKGKARFRKAYPLWRTAQDRFTSLFGQSQTEKLR